MVLEGTIEDLAVAHIKGCIIYTPLSSMLAMSENCA